MENSVAAHDEAEQPLTNRSVRDSALGTRYIPAAACSLVGVPEADKTSLSAPEADRLLAAAAHAGSDLRRGARQRPTPPIRQ